MDAKRTKDLKAKMKPSQRDMMEHKRQQKNIIVGKRAEDEKNRIRSFSNLDYVKKKEANEQ